MSQSAHIYTSTLRTSLYTSTYDRISAPVWVDSKINSIKLDHFTPLLNQSQVNSNINSRFLFPRTRQTWSISTKIYILFPLFAHDLEDSIEYFLLRSNFMTLSHNRWKYIDDTVQVASYIFLYSSIVLQNWWIQVHGKLYDSGFPMQDYFEQISNEIIYVNSFFVSCNYHQFGKDRRVLEYTIQDSQCDITLRKSQMRLPV